MNAQDAVHWGRRLVERIGGCTSGDSDVEEPTPGALWKKAYPNLMDGLDRFGKIEFSSIPESRFLPFRPSKSKCREELGQILDQLLLVLGASGAPNVRRRGPLILDKRLKAIESPLDIEEFLGTQDLRRAALVKTSESNVIEPRVASDKHSVPRQP